MEVPKRICRRGGWGRLAWCTVAASAVFFLATVLFETVLQVRFLGKRLTIAASRGTVIVANTASLPDWEQTRFWCMTAERRDLRLLPYWPIERQRLVIQRAGGTSPGIFVFSYVFSVNAWWPLLISLGALMIVLSRGRRKNPYACPNCDYDLRGAASAVCSECGVVIVRSGDFAAGWSPGQFG